MADFETIAAGLRAWAAGDRINPAAVELLIWHGFWLRRADFVRSAVDHYPEDGIAAIRWHRARAFVDAGPRGSTSEVAVLDLAVAIGEDRYRLAGIGHAHAEAIVRTFAQALGREHMLTGMPGGKDSGDA